MFNGNLFVPGKLPYVRKGDRPAVDCILCAVLSNDNRVRNLLLWHGNGFAISLNMYPYNPGHLMVFPERHLCDIRDMTAEEVQQEASTRKLAMQALDEVYQPQGYNLGYNIGKASGASIEHLHMHIVPRYSNELGVVDILSGDKIIIEDPIETRDKLRTVLARLASSVDYC
jgi:ATP adenylyltransferase